MKRLTLALVALCTAGLVHAETASTNAAAELKQDASADAATVANLPANTQLEVLRRRGAWTEVKSNDGKTGWVRMLSLRFGAESAPAPAAAPAGRQAANPLASLGGLLAPSRGNSAATVTTGVRGLDEADLQKAQPNANEFRKMQGYAASKNTANEFARTGRLSAQRVDYLKPAESAAAPAAAPASSRSPFSFRLPSGPTPPPSSQDRP